MPDPYFKALPSINKIINNNRRLNLLDDDISFSQLSVELPQSPSIINKVFNNDGIVRTNITEAPPVLAASGQNQNLTRPVQLRDVFDDTTSIV